MNFAYDLEMYFRKMKEDIIERVAAKSEVMMATIASVVYDEETEQYRVSIEIFEGDMKIEIPHGCLLFSSDFLPKDIKFDRFRLPLKMRFGNDHLVDQDNKDTIYNPYYSHKGTLNDFTAADVPLSLNVISQVQDQDTQKFKGKIKIHKNATNINVASTTTATVSATSTVGVITNLITDMGHDHDAEIEIPFTDFNAIWEFLPENDSTADIHEEGDKDDLSSLKGLKDGNNGGMRFVRARMFPKLAVGDAVLVREIPQPGGTVKYFLERRVFSELYRPDEVKMTNEDKGNKSREDMDEE